MLTEDKRVQLDGIVHKMLQNKEPDSNIRFVVDDFKKKYDAPPPLPTPGRTDTNAQYASFPAMASDSPLTGSAKLVGNIPSSAVGFAKNTVQMLNPVNALNTLSQIPGEFNALAHETGGVGNALAATAKEIPKTAYHALVPQFIQHIMSGDFQGAADTVRNDPVGQLAPLILVGRQVAGSLGKGAQFDSAMSTIAKPVTKPIGAAGTGATNLAVQTLGATTGAGASSLKAGFNAAKSGSSAFTDAMRGKTNPDEVVQAAQDAVQNIANKRGTQYRAQLEQLAQNKTNLDISPVHETLGTQLNNFGIKAGKNGELDFSRSSIANNGSARADVQGVYDTLKSWGSKSGDRTPAGVDILKKQLGDFYSQSNSARALVQSVKASANNILQKQVPGYSEMTKGYANASALLDDIKSATGVGGKAKVDTVFTKLTTAMKGDKELRLEIMKEMMNAGGVPDLESKIAGTNMQSLIPKGLIGRGVDVSFAYAALTHVFSPSFLPALLSTSPRVVGEFVNALGVGAKHAQPIIDAVKAINQAKLPPALENKTMKDVPLGLSTKSILDPMQLAKTMDAADIKTVRNYLDVQEGRVRAGGNADIAASMKMEELLNQMGVKPTTFASQSAKDAFIGALREHYEADINEAGGKKTYKQDTTTGRMQGSARHMRQ